MEFIRPSVEIWEQGNTLEDMWKHIARCTRVCYQSTPKENGETDEEFVKRVILRKNPSTGQLEFDRIHGAMLEHGTVYLKVPVDIDIAGNYLDDVAIWTKCCLVQEVNPKDNWWAITTNYRVLIERKWLDDLKYICAPTEHHARRVTVSFITNIGVSREFNRHRVDSIAEESTRYCNYNKRNDGSVKFALPAWIDEEELKSIGEYKRVIRKKNPSATEIYITALLNAEDSYNKLIKLGWIPQQAREVLPLATKTQLIHTAFVDDWKHFFALRADGVSGPPHPNAAFVAKPLKEEFIKNGYII